MEERIAVAHMYCQEVVRGAWCAVRRVHVRVIRVCAVKTRNGRRTDVFVRVRGCVQDIAINWEKKYIKRNATWNSSTPRAKIALRTCMCWGKGSVTICPRACKIEGEDQL